jgi:hypothetical protein
MYGRQPWIEFATFTKGEYVESVLISRDRAQEICSELERLLAHSQPSATGDRIAGEMLSDRERATVLAALRYWRREGLMSSGRELDIADDHGRIRPLSAAEIDFLCERLGRTGSGGNSHRRTRT